VESPSGKHFVGDSSENVEETADAMKDVGHGREEISAAAFREATGSNRPTFGTAENRDT
jgi:hypothetical protein